ncbi:unnamed protein product, partial [Ectocarpus sp. 12 AP-2014]
MAVTAPMEDYSRTMLSKLSKQQHLVLRELERTKRRLREEVWAREEKTTKHTAQPTDPGDPYTSWSSCQARGSNVTRPSNIAPASPSKCSSNGRSAQMTGARAGPNARDGARLKRSRTEAGMSPVGGGAAGADKARSMKL